MQVLDADELAPLGGASVVTVGRFDGVHLGHQAVLSGLCESAEELSARPAVVVVDPELAGPAHAASRLSPLDLKLELLAHHGVDTAVVVAASRAGHIPAILVDTLGTALLVAGESGLPTSAASAELPGSVPVRRVPVVRHSADGAVRPVTSELIVGLLGRGGVEAAAALLGRPHEVRGVVSHGDARGRTLGFPTANIPVPIEVVLPADGVYAGHYLRPDGTSHVTAISLGRRPTFYEERGARLLEAHLLDFEDDLYGEIGVIRFERLLRGQRRFESIEALVDQLGHDVDATRRAIDPPPGA